MNPTKFSRVDELSPAKVMTGQPAKPASAGPAEPSTMELAANFAGAVGRWSSAGFPVVSPEIYAARAEACDGCRFWDGKARLGLGKCGAPGCGCTSLKRWLATERCPHPDGSRWPVDNPAK